jgi:hypothetical protein
MYAYQEQLLTWDAKYPDASGSQPQSRCDISPGLFRLLNILLRALIGVLGREYGVSQHPTLDGVRKSTNRVSRRVLSHKVSTLFRHRDARPNNRTLTRYSRSSSQPEPASFARFSIPAQSGVQNSGSIS